MHFFFVRIIFLLSFRQFQWHRIRLYWLFRMNVDILEVFLAKTKDREREWEKKVYCIYRDKQWTVNRNESLSVHVSVELRYNDIKKIAPLLSGNNNWAHALNANWYVCVADYIIISSWIWTASIVVHAKQLSDEHLSYQAIELRASRNCCFYWIECMPYASH